METDGREVSDTGLAIDGESGRHASAATPASCPADPAHRGMPAAPATVVGTGPAVRPDRDQVMSSIRWRATRAHSAVSASTDDLVDHLARGRATRGTTPGAARRCGTSSSTGTRAGRATRPSCRGGRAARRCTMWISVPTPITAPGRRGLDPVEDALGGADLVGDLDHLVRALGVHDHLPSGCSARNAATWSGVKRWCTEHQPRHSRNVASLTSRSSRPPSSRLRVPDAHVGLAVAHGEPGVAAEVLVGEEQHLVAPGEAPTRGRPGRWTTCTPRRRASPTNALIAAEEFM